MFAATGLIAGIISLGENVTGGMEHLDSMSHEETNLSAKGDRLLTRMRQQRGRRGGERGEATAPQVVPKTKGFPWLKTQLQSLFLAVISQV